MTTPKKVTVHQEPEGPVYTYLWRDWGMIILLPFGLVFTAAPFWILSLGENTQAVIYLFVSLFAFIGLGMTYYSLGRIINRTEIRLQHGRLSARQKPLPWRYNAELEVSDIQAISQETYFNQSRDRQGGSGYSISVQTSIRNERLVAFPRGRKPVILIPKMELAAARFLEQEIETSLGLRQAVSALKQEEAVQSAQQEQKLVEAGQLKMMFPILIVGIPLLLCVGIILLVNNITAQREAQASLSWPSTVGHSTNYTVYEHTRDSDNDTRQLYYTAGVEYTYIVEGEAYTFEQQVPGTYASEDEAAMFVETNIPENSPLTLYYNPEKPTRALSDRSGPGTIPLIMAGVCVVGALLGLVALIFGAKETCKAEGCPDAWKEWRFWGSHIPFVGQFLVKEQS